MSLNNVSIWAGIISDITSAFAFIVGGIWFCWKYIFMRTGAWNLKMAVKPEIFHNDDNQYILKINVDLINVGNIKITPGSKGCLITVRALNADSKEKQIMDLDTGKPIVEEYDLLRKYYRPEIGYKNYEIEPNSEYHEVACIKVSQGDILSIRTEFFWKDNSDSITEYSLLYVE